MPRRRGACPRWAAAGSRGCAGAWSCRRRSVRAGPGASPAPRSSETPGRGRRSRPNDLRISRAAISVANVPRWRAGAGEPSRPGGRQDGRALRLLPASPSDGAWRGGEPPAPAIGGCVENRLDEAAAAQRIDDVQMRGGRDRRAWGPWSRHLHLLERLGEPPRAGRRSGRRWHRPGTRARARWRSARAWPRSARRSPWRARRSCHRRPSSSSLPACPPKIAAHCAMWAM